MHKIFKNCSFKYLPNHFINSFHQKKNFVLLHDYLGYTHQKLSLCELHNRIDFYLILAVAPLGSLKEKVTLALYFQLEFLKKETVKTTFQGVLFLVINFFGTFKKLH